MTEVTTIKQPLTSAGGANINPKAEAGCYPGADCEPFGEGSGSPHDKSGQPPANLRRGNAGPTCSTPASGANGDLEPPSGALAPYGNEGRNSA